MTDLFFFYAQLQNIFGDSVWIKKVNAVYECEVFFLLHTVTLMAAHLHRSSVKYANSHKMTCRVQQELQMAFDKELVRGEREITRIVTVGLK